MQNNSLSHAEAQRQEQIEYITDTIHLIEVVPDPEGSLDCQWWIDPAQTLDQCLDREGQVRSALARARIWKDRRYRVATYRRKTTEAIYPDREIQNTDRSPIMFNAFQRARARQNLENIVGPMRGPDRIAKLASAAGLDPRTVCRALEGKPCDSTTWCKLAAAVDCDHVWQLTLPADQFNAALQERDDRRKAIRLAKTATESHRCPPRPCGEDPAAKYIVAAVMLLLVLFIAILIRRDAPRAAMDQAGTPPQIEQPANEVAEEDLPPVSALAMPYPLPLPASEITITAIYPPERISAR